MSVSTLAKGGDDPVQDIGYWLLQSLGFGPLTAVDDDDAPTHRCWRLSLLFL